MTDWAAPFELRRLLVRFTRTPAGGLNEDVDVITFHLAKIVSGSPDAGWVTADYTAAEARLNTWWNAIKPNYPAAITLADYRWYRDGPVWSPTDRAPGPSNPSERLTTRNQPGSGANQAQLPPQCAVSVTRIVSVRKRWGRFYLPGGFAGNADNDGRISAALVTALMTPTVALFNGWRTDGLKPVVFSRGRSTYVTGGGVTIPAHVATAYEISKIQIDNLYDVQRSRRWSGPTARTATVLT